ncbi:unnamed protein product [Onchocerca flexuosa]|uniref:Uncharacterized protein n=1 Tax=Onchocerca flexuosa TaxID=387005 RepID=A0A183HZR8_9BILA|nr:unnamed protein product [Onchocerca flexuosa]
MKVKNISGPTLEFYNVPYSLNLHLQFYRFLNVAELSYDFLSNRFRNYNDLFNARNYMEGLNDVITESVQKIIDHFNVSLILHI